MEASQGRSAGLVSRTAADVVDVLVAVAVVLVAYLGLSAFRFVLRPRVFQWPEPGTFRLSALAAGLFVLYLTAGWSITGRTIGKQVMGLRAVRTDGTRIGVGRALHDLLVGTAVQYDWRRRLPSSEAPSVTP